MADMGMFIQRSDTRDIWEEVDQFIWDNWQHALLPDNQPRYTGNRFKRDEKGIDLKVVALMTKRELAMIARILGIKEADCPAALPNGFVRRPEFIKVKQKKKSSKEKIVLHEVFGSTFHKLPAQTQTTQVPDQQNCVETA